MPLEPGLSAELELTVGTADTSIALRSGDVEVIGTPRVVALCEEASLRAIEGQLADGCTSVGMRVQLDHLHPTGVGLQIRAEATLERVEGRRLVFNVAVHDNRGLVAAGKVTRVVVDRERFLDNAT